MSVIRLPLLCAFVGGCLSSAVVFGLWQADREADTPAPKHAMRKVEVVAPARALTNAEPHREPIVDRVVEPGPSAPSDAPVAQDAKSAQDSDSAVPAGSAVSDVLTRLEAEYRERVAASAPAPSAPPAAVVPASTLVPVAATVAVAPAAVAQVAAVAPIAAVAPVVAIAPAPATPAPAPVVAIAAQAPVAQAAMVQAAVSAAPAYAPQTDPRARDVHIGDITQNTYITNVRQGDVYLMQMQQIAMLQYMQLMGMQAAGGALGPMRQVRAVAPQRFTSGITNPDNPWGFNFAPPNLVR